MRWIKKHLVLMLGLLVLAYTFVPIGVVVLMSFNDPDTRNIYRFDGFTLHNWTNMCEDPSMCDALWLSIRVGLLATLVATILGTLAAFALVRHAFAGRSSANLLIFLPMAAPEIVLGSSLLTLFVQGGFAGQLGFWTIFIAHVMFCLSFVVVTVRSRLGRHGRRTGTGGGGPLCHADADLHAGDLPAGAAGHPGRRAAELLAVASTTSSSPT